MNEERELTTDQLLELFKHWDKRVECFDRLFFPLSFAVLPAVLASGKDDFSIYLVGAITSMAFYWFYLMVIRKIACFQDAVFEILDDRGYSDLQRVLSHNPKKYMGVRKIRKYGIFVLAALWCVVFVFQPW